MLPLQGLQPNKLVVLPNTIFLKRLINGIIPKTYIKYVCQSVICSLQSKTINSFEQFHPFLCPIQTPEQPRGSRRWSAQTAFTHVLIKPVSSIGSLCFPCITSGSRGEPDCSPGLLRSSLLQAAVGPQQLPKATYHCSHAR